MTNFRRDDGFEDDVDDVTLTPVEDDRKEAASSS
eukprot:CAMPEP_0195524796 /NCGR_PEP_ID=MMETSP0794_2-20130614/24852_1 /TAXON_ID=515487 /ORGANISM="Stephanopyxis turris, Strain CCMP 815" /LENGTH=33 /DNA_ID= /DNA_START= /DNA_END= /DNA_ORIENTATION=